jgi:NAD(P)-dependent dehydrogenase (short-subunit alcohol dehydrogenase family)
MSTFTKAGQDPAPAFVVTGPTSGIGRRAALELARYGHVVLVGRDPAKLDQMRVWIERRGQKATAVVCDLSSLPSVKQAADTIVSLGLPIAGVLNNAGVFPMGGDPMKTKEGWDLTFTTNHLGPFLLTEKLLPHLADGTTVVFVASAVEDPERKPAVAAGFRGGRYVSVEASVRGEWKPEGSATPSFDAYATSKQAVLASALELAREVPRLRFLALEPGITPSTQLSRGAPLVVRVLAGILSPILAALVPHFSTPARAGRVSAQVLLNAQGQTGLYYDENGRPMAPSRQSSQREFGQRVVAETREFLRKQG